MFQGGPAPGLTCPTAHRAGAPRGGPCPDLWLLRLEVGEGDVWVREVTILLPVAPVNLRETDRGQAGGQSLAAPEGLASAPTMPHLATQHRPLVC